MNTTITTNKPYSIDKRSVVRAYKAVKSKRGAAGVDGQTLGEFDKDLKGNLYKIWNRMSSGSYFPPPVRAVSIPKKGGDGERILGVPTVGDRIAQMVVAQYLEPILDPIFLPDSYGYRPKKSALDAVGVTRERCWKYDWVLEFDIKGLLDVASYYTFSFFERVEEVRSSCRYLNSYAFCPSAIDVNGLELAALYTLQDGLPRDAE
jgi:RNA-directed DNA polymerase